MTAPERSARQRLDALARANEIRSGRARLKEDLKAGRASVHEVLLEPPDFVATAKVWEILSAVPKYGQVKVNKTLKDAGISPTKRVGGLSPRQRGELASLMRR